MPETPRRDISVNGLKCRHWRGCMVKTCGAGLVPRDLAAGPTQGWVLRVQCAGRQRSDRPYGVCDRYERWTQAELAARAQAHREAFDT